jgi:Domain of unknown function (DUF4082)/Fibronectin type III domain/Bacterial Ig domain
MGLLAWRRATVVPLVGGALVAGLLTAGPLVVSRVAAATLCGPPVVNPVACENTLPGDPESDWTVSGAGDATIQGFATSMSVNVGQTVNFKISTPAHSYHLDMLRLGYYQGNGARIVAAGVRPSATLPQTQPACLTDSSTGLIDCGNWGVSASWTVPATAVSGVYLAHLVRDDTGGDSQIPFAVRDDSSHSNIVVQTSDTTWQAYNTYGGNSLYSCTVACPPGNPGGYKGAFKVSYNRPFHTALDDQGRSWLTYTEIPMIRFLESNGYDVSYISGGDTDSRGPLLLNHKVFLSSGHDEYWSGNQRANVEAARNAGINLAFFSGNESFWKTRWEPSTDGSNTPERTLVTYKETHFDAPTDPKDPATWTGTWRDPRFSPPADGGRPENALTGQFFIVNSGTTDIQVPAQYAKLRMWRNTAVANLTGSQTLTLGKGIGTLGYEWDEDADNGFRPAGLMDLSSTTLPGAQVFIDYGTNVANGTATHHLTLYRAPSGALVFGAGTVQWAWGLDGDFTGLAPDRNMQQATVNLFADLGAQPATLRAGLVPATASSDTTAPTSTITSPAPGANLQDGGRVTISGTAADSGGGVVAGVEVSTDGGATWHPATGTTNWSYSWVAHGAPTTAIRSRAVDDSGNMETPSAGTSVTVGCPCSLWGPNVGPAVADADGGNRASVEVGVKFTSDVFGTVSGLRFYKASTNTGTHVGNLWSASGQLLATATFSGESASGWQQVTFAKPVAILPLTTYVASYFAPNGHDSATVDYFYPQPAPAPDGGGILDSPPLHAIRQTAANPNGVFALSGTSTFPTTGDVDGANYWVDVAFSAASVPGQATNVTATGGYSSAGLSWTAPTTGGPATSYTVTPYVGGVAQTPVPVTGTPAPTSTTVTGLTNGTTYTFTVTANNPVGAGPPSAASNGVTPSATASVVINGGFEGGLPPWSTSGTPPVVAIAKAHTGTASALVGTAAGADQAGESSISQTVTVPAGTSSLSFWYWPATNDSTCTGTGCIYDWQEAQIRTTGGATLASAFKSCSNSQAWTQVTFNTSAYAGQTVVLWFNVHGDGSNTPDNTWMYLDDVALSATGVPTAPAAPTSVAATAGNGQATVTWTAPANGGSPLTSYTVTPLIAGIAQPNTTTITGNPPATTATATGLTNGTTYTFTVTAANGIGTGPPSAASNAVTPTVAPAFVQKATGHSGDVASIGVTPTAAITAGNRLVVMVGVWNSPARTTNSVTDSAGNTYTELLHFTASDNTEMSVWSAPVTAGGGTRPTITATPTAAADMGITVLEYSGLSTAAGAGAVDQQAHATGTTNGAATVASGATPAATAGNELAIGFYTDSGFGDNLTAGSGYAARANVSPTGDFESLTEDQPANLGATPNATTGTGANTIWLMATIVFKHA